MRPIVYITALLTLTFTTILASPASGRPLLAPRRLFSPMRVESLYARIGQSLDVLTNGSPAGALRRNAKPGGSVAQTVHTGGFM
ncbi:hypothetical protein DFP72DRAFT_929503 [Ephemerocybe angulata]|uniref:Uncharacterized protein n=1 Tax=Ephemerocybe angulata TaxID=980116 RepID=A0A8H6LUJ7_9AGAR|nr:hypothetical protein DFP72DRAFT_929503 [Tulosesus angulatus]